ncbi:PAS domain S-box protein, partial [Marinobacter sp.]
RKPFDPEELLATVEGVLGKQSLIRAHEMVQSRLEKSEALHRYIVNSSPDIVFMLDETGHICFINNKVESLLGYQPSELCGQHFRHILDDRDVARGTYAL